ncbi:transposase [Thiomicrospira microaerophila]|uniref:transposase n=1 Tax=Thiomicrospira microaerophila TaxID=406020 RepID=UPI00200F35F3|nr:transposase [Thiomicrospira microaerophila]UQB42515.1 transposase [Thiomicrospira microaerophila]
MARPNRITPCGVPVHVIQRGNNRQVVFADESDFKAYLHWLQQYAEKYSVAIHAWCLMTNHVHLLCTAHADLGISQMMQAIGRQYVRYFNHKYQRTGTLWEGRFKSCLVEAEHYLFELYRYIELNPVRAKMVKDPADYPWSSYQVNALNKESQLQTPHPLYLALDPEPEIRKTAYQNLFQSVLNEKTITDIRQSVNKGLAIGGDSFKKQLEALSGRKLIESKRGRPIGWRKNEEAI